MKFKTSILSCFCLFVFLNINAQSIWKDVVSPNEENIKSTRLTDFRVLQLDKNTLVQQLQKAPLEFTQESQKSLVEISLPLANGENQRFRIVESTILEPKLAARYPHLKTYTAQGIDDPTIMGRLQYNGETFGGYLLTQDGVCVIDPVEKKNANTNYLSYYKHKRIQKVEFSCEHEGHDHQSSVSYLKNGFYGEELRTYRLAVSATAEYTAHHGGTVEDGLEAIMFAVNRINAVYERDLAIRFILVNDNDQIIFTNPSTDPFNNNSAGQMLNANRNVINNAIGAGNYDIGHVFATGGSGLASLAVVCRGDKAEGTTGINPPSGDDFIIDYVAHEIGHQFGAEHTFNNCGGNESFSTAYEPGSGSTIMAYAGLCGSNNVQNGSDDYFHGISLQQILNYSDGTGGNCPSITPTGNTPPTVDAGQGGFFIPIETPFVLIAEGNDADGDELTYCWEQFNNGPVSTLGAPSGSAPSFRSWNPTDSPVRYCPNLQAIVAGSSPNKEVLPTYSRPLTFNVVARDNRAGGGGVAWDAITFQSTADAGPFVVTSQTSSSETWETGTDVTITWDVANTNQPPVNCMAVDIFLSKNLGFNFPITLGTNLPNTGSAVITVPQDAITNFARVMVKAADNIFLDVNPANFKIIQGPPTATTDLKAEGISIRPNPVDAFLSIELEETVDEYTPIQVYNTAGQLMTENKLAKGQRKIQLATDQWIDGLYFVRLWKKEKWVSTKIVVQH